MAKIFDGCVQIPTADDRGVVEYDAEAIKRFGVTERPLWHSYGTAIGNAAVRHAQRPQDFALEIRAERLAHDAFNNHSKQLEITVTVLVLRTGPEVEA